jgi:hypothetical protein
MTKLIAIFIIVLVLFGAWKFFLYWEEVKNQNETKQKREAAAAVTCDQLPGVPQKLEPSLQAASKSVAGLKNWLRANDRLIQDPRKACVELDYCLLLSRDDLPEARRVFNEVKKRVGPASPVWPRIQQLDATYHN